MAIPSEAELRRFFEDETVAREVYRTGVTTSWLSLRILDYLYRDGPASTGDVARGLNMDMREVRDRLEQLAEIGVVADRKGTWEAATDEITVCIERADGVAVSHTVGERAEADIDTGDSDGDTGSTDDDGGFLGNLVRRLTGMLRP